MKRFPLPKWPPWARPWLLVVGLTIIVINCVLLASLLMRSRGTSMIGLLNPSPSPTWTLAPTMTPTPEPTSTPSPTSEPTATPTPTAEPTATSTPTVPPTATSTATIEPTATSTPTASPTATSTTTTTPTSTSTPTLEPTPTPTLPKPTPTRVVWPTPTPTPVPASWHGEYYDNADLKGSPILVRDDPVIGYNWGFDAPAPGLPIDHFSVRWTRVATFEEGVYDFHATMDDGMRVYVDDELLIDEWLDEAQREVTASRHMSAGNHKLRVVYFERRHHALAYLWWEKPRLYPDWKGMYWDNQDLQGIPVLIRNDPAIRFDWQMDSPGEGIPSEHFSARWTRALALDPGLYRFTVRVDDGARLWVDDQLVIDAWYNGVLRTVTADYVVDGAGQHTIVVEYYDDIVHAAISVDVAKIGPPIYNDWKGEYWSNLSLSGAPALIRNDRTLEFDWEQSAPAPNLPVDDFSARWTRREDFEPGMYRFYAFADDGVRFYIDDEKVLDEWHSSQERTYKVDQELDGEYDLRVEFYEGAGDARIRFWWKQIED